MVWRVCENIREKVTDRQTDQTYIYEIENAVVKRNSGFIHISCIEYEGLIF